MTTALAPTGPLAQYARCLRLADTVEKVANIEGQFFRRNSITSMIAAVFPLTFTQGVGQRDVGFLTVPPAYFSNRSVKPLCPFLMFSIGTLDLS